MNFSRFNIEYEKIYPNRRIPEYFILEWLIGYFEVVGKFNIFRGYPQFVITLPVSELYILKYIKGIFGFGYIMRKDKYTYMYIISDYTSVFLLILLFNGNIVLERNYLEFIKLVEVFNTKYKVCKYHIDIISTLVIPSIDTKWMLGFIEARKGRFSCYFGPTDRFYIMYIMDEVDINILSYMADMFNGIVGKYNNSNMYVVRIKSITKMFKFITYFSKYTFHTYKKAYEIKDWMDVYAHLLSNRSTKYKKYYNRDWIGYKIRELNNKYNIKK